MQEIYKKRVKIIQKQIKSNKWDTLWLINSENVTYLSGYTGSNGWLIVPKAGKALLLTDGRYAEQVKRECPGSDSLIRNQDFHGILIEWIRKTKIRKIGFEEQSVTVSSWKKVTQALRTVKFETASGLVEHERLIKDETEIGFTKKAVAIAERAYKKVLPQIKVGCRERDVALMLEKELIEAGGEGLAFPTIVASGQNSTLPHAKPTQKRLKKGDLVILDFGCTYKGYHSDLTRTIAVAKMTDKQQEIYKIVKNAQVSAQKMLVSGQLVADSDIKARHLFEKQKLEQFFVHSLGHGMGLEIHEAPRLSKMSKERLDSGMVVTCEPGLYIPGWGGIRIEDDVLVGEGISKWLSKSPATLPLVDANPDRVR